MKSEFAQSFQPCNFPILDGRLNATSEWHSLPVPLPEQDQHCFLHTALDVTFLELIRTAWALLLHCYTGNDWVCYGQNLSSLAERGENQDHEEELEGEILYALIDENDTVKSLNDKISAISYESLSMELAINSNSTSMLESGISFFNTAISYSSRSHKVQDDTNSSANDQRQTHPKVNPTFLGLLEIYSIMC